MKKGRKYDKSLPRALYNFFVTFEGTSGAPSFSKFAKSIGTTNEELEGFRKHKEFDRAYRECIEIRRDYLIDMALTKRFDSSLVKFLLSDESAGAGETDNSLSVSISVVD